MRRQQVSPIVYFGLLLYTVLVISGCVQQNPGVHATKNMDGPLLRVGISTNAPPLAYLEHSEITGLEADFARGLAEYTKRKLKFVSLKWEDQIPQLMDGKIDIIMSGMTATPARQYQLSFCEPYLFTSQIFLVRSEEQNRFRQGFPALLNPEMRVGTVRGTTGDLFIASNKAKGKRTQFDVSLQGLEALLKKEIDAFVYDLPGALYYAARYRDQGVTPIIQPLSREPVAWAVTPANDTLRTQANAYLASLKKSRKLQAMVQRWIPFYKNLYNQ